MVICLDQGAVWPMLMLLLLTVTCFSKIQIGFTFLVPTHVGSPGKRAVKRSWLSPPLAALRCVMHFRFYG